MANKWQWLSRLMDRSWKERFWWFDVVYPIALALLLFGALTYVTYSGKRHMRLSMEAERQLLIASLQIAGEPRDLTEEKRFALVSPTAFDAHKFGRSGEQHLELSPKAYGDIIRQLDRGGAKKVVLVWRPEFHPADVDVTPLVEAINAAHLRVILAAPFNQLAKVPRTLRDATEVFVDDQCTVYDPPEPQTQCAFSRKWDDWIVQILANEYLPTEDQRPAFISEQLAIGFPAYILRLGDPKKLPHLSVSALLDRGAKQDLSAVELVFVGMDLAQSESGNTAGSRQRVLTIYDDPSTDLSVGGTAQHAFWAALTEMFASQRYTYVPEGLVINGITIVFCLFVWVVMWFYGGPLALGMFVVYVACGPLVNALAMQRLGIYVPLFDSYYFGLTTLIVTGFSRLSFAALEKWRLREQATVDAHVADLKGNFISLLSHNLNTPIAKMQGMLALLASQPTQDSWQDDIRSAEAKVAELELAVRSVLVATAVEEGGLRIEARRAEEFFQELEQEIGNLIQRLGAKVEFAPVEAAEPDLLFYPLYVDQRACGTMVAALVSLYILQADKPVETALRLKPKIDMGDEGPQLTISMECEHQWLPKDAVEILSRRSELSSVRHLRSGSFLVDVFSGVISSVVHHFDGAIRLSPKGRGGYVQLTLSTEKN